VSCIIYLILFVDTISLMIFLKCKRREYASQVPATVSVLFETVSFTLFITKQRKLPFTNFKLDALTERRPQNCMFRNLSLFFRVSSSELGKIPLAENMVDEIWCHVMVWCYNMLSCCIMVWCYNMVSSCIMVWCYNIVSWCDVMAWCYNIVSLWCDVIIWCHTSIMVWCYGVMAWCYNMVSYYSVL
jgi:hypothetical protein